MKSTPVTFEKVIDTPFNDERKGVLPQQIRIKKSVTTFVSLESINEKDTAVDTPQNVLFKTDISILRAKRVGVSSFAMAFNTPNVNIKNNVLAFRTSTNNGNTFVDKVVIIPEGFYVTPDELIDEMIVQMNAASGLTFSRDPAVPFQSNRNVVLRLTDIGQEYVFLDKSILKLSSGDPGFSTVVTSVDQLSMMEKGEPLVNLPRLSEFPPNGPLLTTDFTETKLIGSINLQYTRFVDVVSKKLTNYSTVNNSSNSTFNGNLIYRLYLKSSFESGIQPNKIISNQIITRYINHNPQVDIREIDITIIDQFGELFYVAPGSANTVGGFNFNLFLEVQG